MKFLVRFEPVFIVHLVSDRAAGSVGLGRQYSAKYCSISTNSVDGKVFLKGDRQL